jgi:hypothetical protein
MRFCKKDTNCHLIFEEADDPIQQKEDGTLWWDAGCGLKLQLHFQEGRRN